MVMGQMGLSAATVDKAYNKSISVGNSTAGAVGSIGARMKAKPRDYLAKVSANGNVKFLGLTVKAAEFEAKAKADRVGISNGYYVKLVGATVASKYSSASVSWSKSYPKTFVRASSLFWVGPVPVTISGSLGGGVGADCELSANTNGVSLEGGVNSWLSASASAGFGFPGASVSLSSRFQLGGTGIGSTIDLGLVGGSVTTSGAVNLKVNPVSIHLSLVAQIAWSRHSLPITSW